MTGGWRRGSFVAYGSVADAIGLLHAQDKPPPDDYVDPSSDHELRTSLGAIFEFSDALYLNAWATAITVLATQKVPVPYEAGDTLLIGSAGLGYFVSDSFKLVVVGQVPVAGQHRFEEKIGLDAYTFF